MTVTTPFQDVSQSLYKLGGVTKVEANLKDQLVSIEGTAAPSAVVEAIQATGRDAILRGSGASNSAAVSILETYTRLPLAAAADSSASPANPDREVRGLARMVQVSPALTLVDLTLRGVEPGEYRATLRRLGDLSRGAASTGGVWRPEESGGGGGGGDGGKGSKKGVLGNVTVGPDGRGAAFVSAPFAVWEVIGRALVVTRQQEQEEGAGSEDGTVNSLQNDANTVVGVVARSAGMWDNDKTVCSCTGKTLWEEREDEAKRGVL